MSLASRNYHPGELCLLHRLAQGPATAKHLILEVTVPDVRPDLTAGLLMNCLQGLLLAGDVTGPGADGTYEISYLLGLEIQAMQRRPLAAMRQAAEELAADLRPLTTRLEIGGSIRRQRADCGDIELCAVVDDMRARNVLTGGADVLLKCGDRYAQVVRQTSAGPVRVDLFQTTMAQEWGMLFFIRTGSADFVRRALAYWKQISAGGECRGNLLWRGDGVQVQTFEEDDVFVALRMKPVPPQKRVPKPQ